MRKALKINNEFYITDDQIAELTTYSYNCKVSELAAEINRVTEENGTKKLSATWINDWLEAEGYLCPSEIKSRIATDEGKKLGITSVYRQKDDGNEYYINLYTEQAQSFVFQHIGDIVAYRNSIRSRDEVNIQTIGFPPELSVKEFIRQQHANYGIHASLT